MILAEKNLFLCYSGSLKLKLAYDSHQVGLKEEVFLKKLRNFDPSLSASGGGLGVHSRDHREPPQSDHRRRQRQRLAER
jgi:hypothetical protein